MPSLTPVVDSLDTVPETARTFYVQKDGKYHLDLAGTPAGFVTAAELAAANGKVVEFRDTNIKLKKDNDELLPLKTQFEGIDPVKAREAIAAQEELLKKGIKKPDDVTAAVNAALDGFKATVVKPLQDQLASMSTTAAEDKKRADNMLLRQTIGERFIKAGGVPEALDFMVTRAQSVFVVEGGALKAAPNQFSADKPGDALGLDEWMTRQTKESAFAFKTSTGGGANPAGGGGGNTTPRAGVTIITDPSPQQLGQYGKQAKEGKVRFEYSSDPK